MESLSDGILIVIRPSTGLSSVKQPLNQLLLITIKEKDSFQVNPFGHYFFPHVHILLSSREAVQQVPTAIIIALYLLLDQLDHQFTGDQLALTDLCFDLFSEW
jgi:hypothetical protein